MHVVISLLNFRPGLIGGTETYLRRLIPSLAVVMPAEHRLTLLVHKDNAQSIPTPPKAHLDVLPLSGKQVTRRRALEAATPWRDRLVERHIGGLNPGVTLFPQQSIYPLNTPGVVVLTVHDLQHITRPDMVPLTERVFRRFAYASSLQRADRVIAISRHVASEISRYTATPPDKINVVPHGFGGPAASGELPLAEAAPHVQLPKNFLYYPAATHPHKGHSALFRTLAALPAQQRPHLVMTGQQTSHWKKLERLAHELGVVPWLNPLGYVSVGTVHYLYERCHSVVFPSMHEGFGLPVVEAAYLGCRLITSDLPVFREIGVPDENRIDFADPQRFANALATLPKPTVLTKRPLSWREHGELTLQSLKAAVKGTQ